MKKVGPWLVLVVVGAALTRTVIALPEHCGDGSPAAIEATARSTVEWFVRNQRPDGRWLYRYDTASRRELGGYSWIRHAGVLLSLEQAAAEGFADARRPADNGREAIVSRLVARGDQLMVDDGGVLTTGGTGLLVAALGERRLATGAAEDDERLRALGRFLAARVGPDGSVDEDGTGDRSPFSTGEAMFGLARLERLFPDEDWDEPVRRIARYLATERAEREGYVPDTSDHWSAYAFAEVERWPAAALTAEEVAFARKQMGILGIQVRYESQRTNGGVDRWTRGRQALGSGVGTLGEALAAWSRVAASEPSLTGQRGWLAERLACTAGMLAARQVSGSPDERANGAFVQFGITQMDDQQHPLSALVGAQSALGDGPLPRRTPVPSSAWLVALAALVAMNPARVAARSRRAPLVMAGGSALMAVLGAVGGPITRGLDISVGTAAVAAGLAVAAAGVAAVIWRGGPGELVPLILRPEVALLAIAAGAGGRGWPFTGGVALAAATAIGMWSWRRPRPEILEWLARVAAVLTVAAGIAITVDGVFAV